MPSIAPEARPPTARATLATPTGLGRLVGLVRALAVLGAASLLLLPPLFWANPTWLRLAAPAAAGLDSSQVTIDAQAQWLGLAGSLPGWAVWIMPAAVLAILLNTFNRIRSGVRQARAPR